MIISLKEEKKKSYNLSTSAEEVTFCPSTSGRLNYPLVGRLINTFTFSLCRCISSGVELVVGQVRLRKLCGIRFREVSFDVSFGRERSGGDPPSGVAGHADTTGSRETLMQPSACCTGPACTRHPHPEPSSTTLTLTSCQCQPLPLPSSSTVLISTSLHLLLPSCPPPSNL